MRSQYLCPGNYRPFKVIQGNTVIVHIFTPEQKKEKVTQEKRKKHHPGFELQTAETDISDQRSRRKTS